MNDDTETRTNRMDEVFTLKRTSAGYEMMVEAPAHTPLFKKEDGLSHRIVLDGPEGGVLAAAYSAAQTALGFYKPERAEAR